jgi:gas vesicle protein
MRYHLMENTLALLGGATLGAGLMYLFDPDQGNRRRREVARAAGQAACSTREAVGATLHGTGHNARSFAHRISDYAHGLASDLGERASDFTSAATESGRKSKHHAAKSARDYASDMADRAGDMKQHLADRASDIKQRLTGRASSMWSKAQRAAMEESYPYATATGITAGAVGLLAMGAGLMYFMDPARGRSRRAWARDKAFSASHRAGKRARRYGRHLGNRMKGVVAEASRAVSSGESEEPSMPTAPTLRRGVAASSGS